MPTTEDVVSLFFHTASLTAGQLFAGIPGGLQSALALVSGILSKKQQQYRNPTNPLPTGLPVDLAVLWL